jgi:DNA polymerase (family 10)
MENTEMARLLEQFGDLLEISGGNPYRVRAYRTAARTVRTQNVPLERLIEEHEDITALPGIGEDMAAHIEEICRTGSMEQLDQLAEETPRSLTELLRLPGLGPKRTGQLWEELDIETVDQLENAARSGQVADLEGFGEKTQQSILEGIQDYRAYQERFLLGEADQLIRPLMSYLAQSEDIERIEVAGSYRRRKETVGDIDVLAIARDGEAVMTYFTDFERVEEVVQSGETRGTVRLEDGLQVDLRIMPPRSFGAALVYFTGSKAHNIHLRRRGLDRGQRISEYGVFRTEGEAAEEDPWSGDLVAGREEPEVYEAVDLPWIPPVLREDRGEIEAAEKGKLPDLLELEDLQGDLQMHSDWSDGNSPIQEMLAACADRGYEYMAITDHTSALAMTGGLDAEALRAQWREMEKVASRQGGIHLLRGLEVDILRDGSLDMEDELLEELDVVVLAVHSYFDLEPREQTERLLRAVDHPCANILAHPTGRKINRRGPMDYDREEVFARALENQVALEINAQPNRLDLDDGHARLARDMGLRLVINTDAHRPQELALIGYGVDQARRAWLEPSSVLNALPLERLKRALAKA